MKITHPFAGLRKATTLSPEVIAYVATLRPLPQVTYDAPYEKAYWLKDFGQVPAGTYTNPDDARTEAAVEGLYHALKGAKITRHRVAVALNLRSADDVDDIRDRLYDRGAGVSKGRPGVSVNSVDPTKWVDVLTSQAAKRAAKAAKAAKVEAEAVEAEAV